MIVDSSALVAIMVREHDADKLIDLIGQTGRCKVPAPALVEASIVLGARGGQTMLDLLDEYLVKARIAKLSFTADHAAVAAEAFLRGGKGRHAAGLNFGDCISYATARLEAMPLLFKGGEFRLTDVECAD